jgi:hypothetical protein
MLPAGWRLRDRHSDEGESTGNCQSACCYEAACLPARSSGNAGNEIVRHQHQYYHHDIAQDQSSTEKQRQQERLQQQQDEHCKTTNEAT